MDENTGHPRQSATKPITRRSSCVAPARHSRCRQTHIRETHTQNALSPSSVCSSGAGVAAVHTTRLPAREKFGRRGACVARSCAKRKTIARKEVLPRSVGCFPVAAPSAPIMVPTPLTRKPLRASSMQSGGVRRWRAAHQRPGPRALFVRRPRRPRPARAGFWGGLKL